MNNKELICPTCQKALPADSDFCQYCGYKIPSYSTSKPRHKSWLIKLLVAFLIITCIGGIGAIIGAVGQNITYEQSQDAYDHQKATLTDTTVGCGSYGCEYCRGLKTEYSYNEYGYPDFRSSFAFYYENDNAYESYGVLLDISLLIFIAFFALGTILAIIKFKKQIKHFLRKVFVKKNIPLIVISILLLIAIVAISILAFYVQDYKRVYEYNRNKVEELEKENKQYYDYWVETFSAMSFYDRFVVFVEDDGTNLYHKYDCKKFKGDSFWAFNVDAAIDNGYAACPHCHD